MLLPQVECLPTCVADGQAPKNPPIKALDYVLARCAFVILAASCAVAIRVASRPTGAPGAIEFARHDDPSCKSLCIALPRHCDRFGMTWMLTAPELRRCVLADRHAKIKVVKGPKPELYKFYDAAQPHWD